MAMVEDIDIFFDLDEFADTATIRAGGAAFTVNGIYNDGSDPILDMESTQPTFQCSFSKVKNVKQGNALTVLSDKYKVVKVLPDSSKKLALIYLEVN